MHIPRRQLRRIIKESFKKSITSSWSSFLEYVKTYVDSNPWLADELSQKGEAATTDTVFANLHHADEAYAAELRRRVTNDPDVIDSNDPWAVLAPSLINYHEDMLSDELQDVVAAAIDELDLV